MSKKSSAFARVVNLTKRLPKKWRGPAISFAFNSKVKFAKTAGIEILSLDEGRSRLRLKNKKRVQNHIQGVHAAAMALLAESATGVAFGYQLPGDKLPLLKEMKLDYVKRAQGDLECEAWLDDADIAALHTAEKGNVKVNFKITDEANVEPIVGQMTWAWISKRR